VVPGEKCSPIPCSDEKLRYKDNYIRHTIKMASTLVITPWNPQNHFVSTKDIEVVFEAMGIASKIPIHDLSIY
jgi:hypothetical protein